MGFSEVWDDGIVNTNYFKEILQRYKDVIQQNWVSNMTENSQCTNYLIFKQN